MNSDDKLKEIGVKNHTCYYFANIAIINDIDFHNILLDWKSFKNILIDDVADKNLYGAKPSVLFLMQ